MKIYFIKCSFYKSTTV